MLTKEQIESLTEYCPVTGRLVVTREAVIREEHLLYISNIKEKRVIKCLLDSIYPGTVLVRVFIITNFGLGRWIYLFKGKFLQIDKKCDCLIEFLFQTEKEAWDYIKEKSNEY